MLNYQYYPKNNMVTNNLKNIINVFINNYDTISSIDDKKLKRAGLDYWHLLGIQYYENLDDFFEKTKGGRYFYSTTKALNKYSDAEFRDEDYILFGKETKGLPEELLHNNKENSIRIPMINEARSLNLSNSVAIVIYEALRQNGFEKLLAEGKLTKYDW